MVPDALTTGVLQFPEVVDDLTADFLSIMTVSTSADVSWTSTNTWSSTGRGEENNTAPAGNDRNLMTEYLDQNFDSAQTTVQVMDILAAFTNKGYDLYVYIKGGVNGRGGLT